VLAAIMMSALAPLPTTQRQPQKATGGDGSPGRRECWVQGKTGRDSWTPAQVVGR